MNTQVKRQWRKRPQGNPGHCPPPQPHKGNARKTALEILEKFEENNWSLDRVMDRVLRENPPDHRDRRFISEIVFGVLKRRLTLDYMIDHYVTHSRYRRNARLRRLLRAGIYQIAFMNKVPDYAVVNEMVRIAKDDELIGVLAGHVNAVLRNTVKTRRRIAFPDARDNLVRSLSVTQSYPEWMIQRWLDQYGLTRTRKLLAFFNRRGEVYIRRRFRGHSRQRFESDVRGITDAATGYFNLYYRLKKDIPLDMLQVLKQGDCVVQSPSSGWATALLGVQRGDRIFDMCCAPGGKLGLIAELADENGAVCAADVRLRRMRQVTDLIRKMRYRNVFPFICNSVCPPISGQFDKVLIDAPCSGTGVIHRHPESRWTKNLDDIMRLAAQQQDLLEASADLVAPGGVLVYATCSIEREENDLQVESFIARHPEFTLDQPSEKIPGFLVDDRGYLRILPCDHGMDGMFGARLRKAF